MSLVMITGYFLKITNKIDKKQVTFLIDIKEVQIVTKAVKGVNLSYKIEIGMCSRLK